MTVGSRRRSRRLSRDQGQGCQVMFLVRGAFWLGLAVLLLPTEEHKQAKLFNTASTAVERVVTFCDRNAATCQKGAEFWTIFVRKAEFGARLAMEIINERQRKGGEQSAGVAPPAPVTPAVLTEERPAAPRPSGIPPTRVRTEAITPSRTSDAAGSIEHLLRTADAGRLEE